MSADPPIALKLALASLSASIAETSTFPIDVIKTHLQLSHSKRASNAAANLWRNGGFPSFYSGLSPAVLRHCFYTPLRIVGYEKLRGFVDEGSVFGKAAAGGLAGGIAQMIASPADLIKVRMQADGRLLNQGVRPRYTGIFDAFTKIIQREGFLGLWKGVVPNAQRAFLVNMGELTCYDLAKHSIIRRNICEDNIYAHSLASVASGLVSTFLSCPPDVVKTRMMNQASGGDQIVYRNSLDCLYKTVKFEGPLALWKGFFPTWARLGPWQFVFWVSYENFRQASGLSSF